MGWNGGCLKGCGCCGRVYEAATWRALPFVVEVDDGIDTIEVRQCACRSSMAIVVGPSRLADTERAPAAAVAS